MAGAAGASARSGGLADACGWVAEPSAGGIVPGGTAVLSSRFSAESAGAVAESVPASGGSAASTSSLSSVGAHVSSSIVVGPGDSISSVFSELSPRGASEGAGSLGFSSAVLASPNKCPAASVGMGTMLTPLAPALAAGKSAVAAARGLGAAGSIPAGRPMRGARNCTPEGAVKKPSSESLVCAGGVLRAPSAAPVSVCCSTPNCGRWCGSGPACGVTSPSSREGEAGPVAGAVGFAGRQPLMPSGRAATRGSLDCTAELPSSPEDAADRASCPSSGVTSSRPVRGNIESSKIRCCRSRDLAGAFRGGRSAAGQGVWAGSAASPAASLQLTANATMASHVARRRRAGLRWQRTDLRRGLLVSIRCGFLAARDSTGESVAKPSTVRSTDWPPNSNSALLMLSF